VILILAGKICITRSMLNNVNFWETLNISILQIMYDVCNERHTKVKHSYVKETLKMIKSLVFKVCGVQNTSRKFHPLANDSYPSDPHSFRNQGHEPRTRSKATNQGHEPRPRTKATNQGHEPISYF
jgi:hypothetical protein